MTYASSSVNSDVARRAAAVRRAQAGDRRALDELIVELTPLLWSVVRRQGVDSASAEDAVQLTWMKFWGALGEIKSPDAVVGWLITVAKREAAKLWRAGRREEPAEPDWDAMEHDGPTVDDHVTDRVIQVEKHQVLWRAFARLEDRCRELMRLVAYVDRPDYDEVSRALGMPRGSIGPTRGRCLAKLRKLLTADPAWTDRVE